MKFILNYEVIDFGVKVDGFRCDTNVMVFDEMISGDWMSLVLF